MLSDDANVAKWILEKILIFDNRANSYAKNI